ncbi:MAG: TonB-dependent receptor [Calditrichaceae bacterium]
MKKLLKLVFLFSFMLTSALSAATISGNVSDSESGEPLAGANVYIKGTSLGAATDENGMYAIDTEEGAYVIYCAYVGYREMKKEITVSGEGNTVVDFKLKLNIMKTSDIVVEANRAKERETPVAFTNVSAEDIQRQFTVQDIPHMFKNTPGVYVSTDGGSGMGDSKVSIRGFDEQRISVMINNIEVNDPESKKVYWSNWGSLPGGSQSIQIQRGAGSSLYGAGTFGGSINVQTADAPALPSLSFISTIGMYDTYKFGVDYNSGLRENNMSFIARMNYMEGNGWRDDTYYQGMSYYFGASYFPNDKHTLRLVLHGAPQVHAYSYFSNSAKSYAQYGTEFNSNAYVKENDPGLTGKEKDGTDLFDVMFMNTEDANQGGEVIGNGNVSFDNNVYHKPQLELHHVWDLEKNTYLQTTAFFSVGRGYGENVNSSYRVGRDDNGFMSMATIDESNQYQYRNYSIHEQAGIVSTFNTKWNQHDIRFGVEGRYWRGRHYGSIINTFGQESIGYYVGGERVDFSEGDDYYDYTTEKPNISAFGHALWKFDKLSIMTDVQLSSRQYDIVEDMPSNNNRPDPNGSYALGDTTYTLVDFKTFYNFISPKLGVNYNINDHFNVFANYSLVYNEPRVKYFYNYGQPVEGLPLEESNDYEIGFGYAQSDLDVKVNLYQIDFSNKSYQITDPSKANTPGYDYKGRRYVIVGDAQYRGIEVALNYRPYFVKGLDLGFSLTKMANEWGDNITQEAQDQLGIEEGKVEPGTPQFMLAGVLNYVRGPFYASASVRYNEDYYLLSDNSPVAFEYDLANDVATDEGSTLPSWTVIDLIFGWRQKVSGFDMNASLHINNLLDEEYYQTGDEYGLLYGPERNVMLNLGVTL